VKVAYPKPEGGVTGLVGAALPLISGEFVSILGGEDELAPDALLEVVRVLQEHPGTDVIYTDEDEIDDNGVRSSPASSRAGPRTSSSRTTTCPA
jgi:hypothetical protein